ncbi:MAG: type II secretion system F family protein, partial [Planctomycetes bacterium]|nr:type II secretion system F family protein [Planctomycetota bacterium]
MPSFTYKAVTTIGQDVAGELEAADRRSALRELVTRGLNVVEVTDKPARGSLLGPSGPTRIRVRPRQLAVLTRQLAIALQAGLPLMTALDVIGRELEQPSAKELLADLARRVQQGASLSDALGEHPRVFEPMYQRLVRVGETGGMLDEVLDQLADMLERRIELRERVKTAAIYPTIVLLLGIASVAVIVTFIVPRILASLGTSPAMMPWPTRVLMFASDVVFGYWWALLGGAAAAVAAWRQGVLRGPGRRWYDGVKLRVPILGRLIRQLESARFARSLGMLARGGVAITESMPVVRDALQNTLIREAIQQLGESIKSGESITAPLQRTGLFPPLLVQMVRVGENTGRLDEMLLRSAAVHEGQARVT